MEALPNNRNPLAENELLLLQCCSSEMFHLLYKECLTEPSNASVRTASLVTASSCLADESTQVSWQTGREL